MLASTAWCDGGDGGGKNSRPLGQELRDCAGNSGG